MSEMDSYNVPEAMHRLRYSGSGGSSRDLSLESEEVRVEVGKQFRDVPAGRKFREICRQTFMAFKYIGFIRLLFSIQQCEKSIDGNNALIRRGRKRKKQLQVLISLLDVQRIEHGWSPAIPGRTASGFVLRVQSDKKWIAGRGIGKGTPSVRHFHENGITFRTPYHSSADLRNSGCDPAFKS